MNTVKDDYIALTATKDIQEIIRPLNQLLGSCSFGYHKIFLDGHEIYLGHDINWIKHVHENNLNLGTEYLHHMEAAKMQNFKATLWPFENKVKIIKEVRIMLDCAYGITFWNGKNEYFGFLIKHEKDISVINRFVNNMEQLERFNQFFQDKAQDLIKKASKGMILHHKREANESSTKTALTNNIFRDQTQIKTFSLPNSNNTTIRLTPREIDCLKLLIHGYTTTETSITLNLSKRTVETHLENIKNKTNTSNKNDLIKLIFNNQIDKYF